MAVVNAYLTFDGNCEEAFEFYKSVFGGDYLSIGRFSEMPEDPRYTVTETDKNRIMHVSLPISQESILMGSDKFSGLGPELNMGNNFSLSANTKDTNEADRIFAALAVKGQVTMPMENTFWGSYFGSLTDKFGINWMVNCDLK